MLEIREELFNTLQLLWFLFAKSYLDLPSNQHGVEAGLYLEDAPSSFGYKLWSQNNDKPSALVHATGQVLNVGCEGETGSSNG